MIISLPELLCIMRADHIDIVERHICVRGPSAHYSLPTEIPAGKEGLALKCIEGGIIRSSKTYGIIAFELNSKDVVNEITAKDG